MVDGVERFSKVKGGGDGAERRFVLVESGGDFVSERKKSGGAGAIGGKAALVWGARKDEEELRTDEALEDFGSRAEKGDGAVGGREVKGFTGFGDGDNKGLFPDSRDITGVQGEIEKGS